MTVFKYIEDQDVFQKVGFSLRLVENEQKLTTSLPVLLQDVGETTHQLLVRFGGRRVEHDLEIEGRVRIRVYVEIDENVSRYVALQGSQRRVQGQDGRQS